MARRGRHAPQQIEVLRPTPGGSLATDTLLNVVRTTVGAESVRFDFVDNTHVTYVLRNVTAWLTVDRVGAGG